MSLHNIVDNAAIFTLVFIRNVLVSLAIYIILSPGDASDLKVISLFLIMILIATIIESVEHTIRNLVL
jgi:formate/nitrite transporter FocA (FNT family)